MPRVAIAGTDTGVGKTVFAAALAGFLGCRYWKPVQAGLDGETDSEAVARLSGGEARVLPEAYRLTTPCSPHQAARIDGVTIDPTRLGLPDDGEDLVVEGAGGVLVPLAGDLLFADIYARWGLPVVLVARTSLGTINHSLLTIEALRARGVSVQGVVFGGDGDAASEEAITRIGNVRHLGLLPRLDPLDASGLVRAFREHIRLDLFA